MVSDDLACTKSLKFMKPTIAKASHSFVGGSAVWNFVRKLLISRVSAFVNKKLLMIKSINNSVLKAGQNDFEPRGFCCRSAPGELSEGEVHDGAIELLLVLVLVLVLVHVTGTFEGTDARLCP